MVNFPRKRTLAFVLALLCLTGVSYGDTSSAEDKEKIRVFLQGRDDWGYGKSQTRPSMEVLANLGDKALPLLAEFLRDSNLGFTTTEVMLELDPANAAPLIFGVMPKSEHNGQRNAFNFYIRQILDGKSFSYSREMHAAAIRCLKAHTDIEIEIGALRAAGLTGSKKDFPILEKYYNTKISEDTWKFKIRCAAQAALARLGHEKYLDDISKELQAPIPAKLSFDWAWRLCESMSAAAFSGNKRFVPLLCVHLDTSAPQIQDDMVPQQPAQAAADALNVLVGGKSPNEHASLKYWREWREKSGYR